MGAGIPWQPMPVRRSRPNLLKYHAFDDDTRVTFRAKLHNILLLPSDQ